MKRAAGVLVFCAIGACGEGSDGAAPRESDGRLIAVHLAHEEEQPGTERAQFEGRTIHLDRDPVFADPELLRVAPHPRDSQLILDIELDPEAARRFSEVTAENIGGSMALVVDSKVVSVSRIRSGIGGGSMQIGVPMSSDEQRDELERRIRARWPPGGSEGDPPGEAASGLSAMRVVANGWCIPMPNVAAVNRL